MRTPAELATELRSRGMKVTPQREAVFRALHENHLHPTAESVHSAVVREMPMVSLRTVYQVLNDLTEMGEIQALDLGTGSARFDPNVDSHHHLVCSGCGKVRDVYGPAVDPPRDAGFTVSSAEVVFRGRCDDCRPSTKESPCPS